MEECKMILEIFALQFFTVILFLKILKFQAILFPFQVPTEEMGETAQTRSIFVIRRTKFSHPDPSLMKQTRRSDRGPATDWGPALVTVVSMVLDRLYILLRLGS